MRYYVWDTDVAKLLGAYATEAEALSLVRTLVAHYGDDYAEDLSVGVERDEGEAGEPLSGADLIARADAALIAEDTARSRADGEDSSAAIAVLREHRAAGVTPTAASGTSGQGRGTKMTTSLASGHVEAPDRRRSS